VIHNRCSNLSWHLSNQRSHLTVEEAYPAEEESLVEGDLQEVEEASPLNSNHKHKLRRNHRQLMVC
jgi:hypothetical protein